MTRAGPSAAHLDTPRGPAAHLDTPRGPAAHLDTPRGPRALVATRHAVVATLRAWGFHDRAWLDAALLVLTELVTNAIRHGGGCVAVDLVARGPRLTMSIVDHSSALPVRRAGDTTYGRGVVILDAFTERWGVTGHGGGKRVWAELPPHPG